MKLYHAGLKETVFLKFCKLFPDKRLNVLKSFGSNNDSISFFIKHRHLLKSLALDSGTYPLNFAEDIDPDKINVYCYRDYLIDNRHCFDFYFNFDEDFSEQGFAINWSNQELLIRAGLSPVPVLHNIYDDELEFYINQDCQRIALGSSQITKADHMIHVMRQLEGTGIKIHLLGNSQFELLANFPIDTLDCTTATITGAYGDVLYWNPLHKGTNKTNRIYLEERLNVNLKQREPLYSQYRFRKEFDQFLCNTFGLEYYDLIGPEGENNKSLVNTYYFAQYEWAINEIHEKSGFNTEK